MESGSFNARQWIDEALGESGEVGAAGVEGVSTLGVLAGLGRRWPGPLTGEEEASLEAICRKIHVAGKVADRYRPGWKRDPGGQPLGADQWRLLLVVLLAYVAAQDLEREEGRGLALKLINAVYAGIDLAGEALAGALRRSIEEGAAGMLEVVLGERGR
jgi:hypothetical protein